MWGRWKWSIGRFFEELPEYLRKGDLMVVNDTRVIRAKLELEKRSGGVVPGLFLREVEVGLWEVMLRTRGRVRVGEETCWRGVSVLVGGAGGGGRRGFGRVRRDAA